MLALFLFHAWQSINFLENETSLKNIHQWLSLKGRESHYTNDVKYFIFEKKLL